MFNNRHIQVRLVGDKEARKEMPGSDRPGTPPETMAAEVIQQVTACVVVGYTVCRSVDFFFRMAEHMIVK